MNNKKFSASLKKIMLAVAFMGLSIMQTMANSGLTEDNRINILFYHISVDVSIDSTFLKGKVVCRFKAVQATNTFNLDLSEGFKVRKIQGSNSYWHKGSKLEIELPKKLAVGQTAEIVIFYDGKPPKVTDGLVTKGLVYQRHGLEKDQPIIATLCTPYLAHFWYPCKDGPSDKADSIRVDITVKDTLIAGQALMGVSNGKLINTIKDKKQVTYQWEHRYPITPYYVLVAISNFKSETVSYDDPNGKKYPLNFYYFPESKEKVQAMIKRLPDIMTFMTNLFGTYPFYKEGYGMTEIGFYSAIETQTNSIMNNLEGKSIPTAVHEAAHQWFGCAIAPSSWNHAWINEGIATYAEALWAQYRYGDTKYNEEMKKNEWYSEGTLYITDVSNPLRVFSPIVYSKGAYFYHILRQTLTDKYFFQILKKMAQDPKFLHNKISTEEFQQYYEKITSEDLETFFKQWVYGEFYPTYAATWSHDKNTKAISLTLNQEQLKSNPPVFQMPVELLIRYDDGSTHSETVQNLHSNQTFTLTPPNGGTPIDVQIDPNKKILKKEGLIRQNIGTKNAVNITQISNNEIGRKLSVSYNTDKKQEITLEILNEKFEKVSVIKQNFNAGSNLAIIEIPEDKVADGDYYILIKSKSEVYKIGLTTLL
jgi:aminopeptidase N